MTFDMIHNDLLAQLPHPIGFVLGGGGSLGAASRLSHIWHTLDVDTVLPGGLFRRAVTLWRSKTSLYETPALAQLMIDEIGDVRIEDLALPYAAMALDVETSHAVRLIDGPLTTAVLASSAIPGVFPSVERGGRQLYDGGLVVNVPVLEALDIRTSPSDDVATRLRPHAHTRQGRLRRRPRVSRHPARRRPRPLPQRTPHGATDSTPSLRARDGT